MMNLARLFALVSFLLSALLITFPNTSLAQSQMDLLSRSDVKADQEVSCQAQKTADKGGDLDLYRELCSIILDGKAFVDVPHTVRCAYALCMALACLKYDRGTCDFLIISAQSYCSPSANW